MESVLARTTGKIIAAGHTIYETVIYILIDNNDVPPFREEGDMLRKSREYK